MSRQARHVRSLDESESTVHIGWVAIEDTEAETSWYERLYGPDESNPGASFSSRDRAATVARPLDHGAVEPVARQPHVGAEPETLTIVPPAYKTVVLPRVKGGHSSSPLAVTATGVVRILLVSLVLYYVLSSSLQLAGRPGLPLAPFPWVAANGAAGGIAQQSQSPLRLDGKVASRVQPMTQMRRVDLYDSRAQFNQWGGAACSAASLAEVLTAYGLPHMTIGRMIREMGADISSKWGLLNYRAFNKVAAKYGLRADVYLENNPISYKQMLYLTNTLGIPVLVNMRATTGYYHYLSGGHILVMTGGDNNRIRLTDSSLYYIKSLPINTYNSMARHRNVVIVPKDYRYTLPR